MNRCVGRVLAHLELEREGLTGGEFLAPLGRKRRSMAGEITTAGVQGILGCGALDRLRLRNEHVSVGHAEERGSNDGHAADRRHVVGVEAGHLREERRGNDWMRVVERVCVLIGS